MTHICASKLTIIGSDNGLLPDRRQAIVWTNVRILLIGPLGTNSSEILIEIHAFSFKKMHLKMSSGKWWPFCLGLNVLTNCIDQTSNTNSPFTKPPPVMFDEHIRLCMDSVISLLKHWGQDKMAAILQTTVSNAFSWMKMFESCWKFHWGLFVRFELTIFQQWFSSVPSHYLKQWWLVCWRIYASLGLNELKAPSIWWMGVPFHDSLQTLGRGLLIGTIQYLINLQVSNISRTLVGN